jgi:hypothetical protein
MKPDPKAPTLRELFPNYSEPELQEAADRLARYLKHSLENYRLLRADPARLATFKWLTAERALRIMDTHSSEQSNLKSSP